jgi:multidrug efflux pump subunit AcrB
MTFVPLLGYYIQRPPKKKELTVEEKRQRGFYGFYNRLVGRAIQHRWLVFAGSLIFLLIGGYTASHLKQQFFPEDVQYWFYLDIWLPNDVPLTATNDTAVNFVAERRVERLESNAIKAKQSDGSSKPEETVGSLRQGNDVFRRSLLESPAIVVDLEACCGLCLSD